MTHKEILRWINNNLAPVIDQALAEARKKNPDLIYTRDWIGAIFCREVGNLIARYASQGMRPNQMHSLMRGDYSQRPGEKEKSYHGYGYSQGDIASYPTFVRSGDWKDPLKCCRFTIAVLEEKRIYLERKLPDLAGNNLQRGVTAAYNCGQGNVFKALSTGKDVDHYTHGKDYSKEVWEFREIFRTIE